MKPKWEYLVRTFSSDERDLESYLNTLGQEGWCLASVGDARYIFMRSLEDSLSVVHKKPRKGLISLTNREHDVVKLVGQGMKNRHIAETLNVQEQSVKNIASSAMRKLDAANRVELVLRYFDLTKK